MRNALSAAVLALGLLAGQVGAQVPKTVVCEDGTATWCQYCPYAYQGIELMKSRYDANEFTPSRLFSSASGGRLATAETDARNNYYAVSGFPTVIFSGVNQVVGGDAATGQGLTYDPIVSREIGVPSPLKITINSSDLIQPSGSIDLTVEVAQEIADISTMKVRVYLLEDNVFWCCGYGGEDTWLDVTRDVMPDVALTVSHVGQTQNIVHNFPIDPAWVGSELTMVAFVQRDSDKYIVQAANTLPKPQYSLRYFTLGDRVGIAPSTGTYNYQDFAIWNQGTSADVIHVALSPGTLPSGWTCAFSDGVTDYTGSVDVPLNAGEGKRFNLKITPDHPGYARPEIVLTSPNLPAVTRKIGYSFVTDDVNVLLIDDDGADTYDNYETDAIQAYGTTFGVISRDHASALSGAQLGNFPVVVWETGLSYPTLDANDRAALGAYLDGGGRLFVTGQEIGWEINDTGGAALTWYHNYLHANFTLDDTNKYVLNGTPGDAISNGMTLTIQGGDGANNQTYPDAITAIAPANTIFTYQGTPTYYGGIKCDTGVYKVVYLSFGFEAISTQANRRLLMQRVLNWFGVSTTDVGDQATLPVGLRVTAAPNPTSGRTTILAELPTSGPVRLDLYAPDGSLVRTLVNGQVEAGSHAFNWDGRLTDGRTAPTGVYFYRLQAGKSSPSGKVVLTR